MTTYRSTSDHALLTGGADGFAEFYRRHEDAILTYFAVRTRRGEIAADLTSETFAAAYVNRDSYEAERGDARGWLFGIAHHVLTRSLERGRVESNARQRLQMEPLQLDDDAIARINNLAGDLAVDALGRLPDDQLDAVTGRVLDDLTYPELAKKLRCSESVVRQRVSRGLRTLRRRLEHKL